jgi:hypothetical protein
VERPRTYEPLDNFFLDQDTIQVLGENFQAAGPLVMVALIGAAGAAIPGKNADFDVVEGRYAALARRVFAKEGDVRAIFQVAAEQGLIEILESDAVRFKVHLLHFHRWTTKHPKAKFRVKKHRTRAADDS